MELNRNETVNIGLAREPRGIIKRDLRFDIKWPFECHAVSYVLMQEGSLSTAFYKSALAIIQKLKARNFGTILDFVPVLLRGIVLFKLLTASESCEAMVSS